MILFGYPLIAWVNAGIDAAIIYSVFCRAAKATRDTDPSIRRAFVMLAFCAYLAGVMPFVHPEHWAEAAAMLAASIMHVQYVTGKFWSSGEAQERFRKRDQGAG